MRQYIGAKIVQAEPQGRPVTTFVEQERGSSMLEGAEERFETRIDESQPGYRVVYPDGYESWSPTAAFEEAYRPTDGMPFGLAIEAMKKGKRVARAGWNGKGMWLALVPWSKWQASTPSASSLQVADFIAMKTTDNRFVPWLASQTDMLADDWQVVS